MEPRASMVEEEFGLVVSSDVPRLCMLATWYEILDFIMSCSRAIEHRGMVDTA